MFKGFKGSVYYCLRGLREMFRNIKGCLRECLGMVKGFLKECSGMFNDFNGNVQECVKGF